MTVNSSHEVAGTGAVEHDGGRVLVPPVPTTHPLGG